MRFTNPDEVEYIFGITLTGNQRMLLLNFFQNGVIPYDGCQVCDAGYVSKLISDMEHYDGPWPWDEATA